MTIANAQRSKALNLKHHPATCKVQYLMSTSIRPDKMKPPTIFKIWGIKFKTQSNCFLSIKVKAKCQHARILSIFRLINPMHLLMWHKKIFLKYKIRLPEMSRFVLWKIKIYKKITIS